VSFGLVSALLYGQLSAEVVKDIRVESEPPGAIVEMLIGTKREPVGQTPLTYRAEFHSEISVLRFSARKPGYVAREFEVTAKDDRVTVHLEERSFTTSPAKLNDPELRKMQEQLAAPTAKVAQEALERQEPFEVDLAREIQVQRIDGDAYLVVPLAVGGVPADYRRLGAGNAQEFLADLWSQLGDAFAMPLLQVERKVEGLKGIVLDVDYSRVQSGFNVGTHFESNVEMQCQPGTKVQSVYNPCAKQVRGSSGEVECVGDMVPRLVFDPCATRVPVYQSKLVVDPNVSFAQATAKARYVASLRLLRTATSAKDVYERIGAVLTDNNGGVLVRRGDLPPSLIPPE
jgi:hypothetical protein